MATRGSWGYRWWYRMARASGGCLAMEFDVRAAAFALDAFGYDRRSGETNNEEECEGTHSMGWLHRREDSTSHTGRKPVWTLSPSTPRQTLSYAKERSLSVVFRMHGTC